MGSPNSHSSAVLHQKNIKRSLNDFKQSKQFEEQKSLKKQKRDNVNLKLNSEESEMPVMGGVNEGENRTDLQKNLHCKLKPQLKKLCEILKLPENVKGLADSYLEYVMNNHQINRDSKTTLHAFLISLCWIAASVLKYKLHHKESIALAKKHLKFRCRKGEAGRAYSMLRCLRRVFLRFYSSKAASESQDFTAYHLQLLKSNRENPCVTVGGLTAGREISDEKILSQLRLAWKDVSKSIADVKKKFDKKKKKLLKKQEEEMQKLNRQHKAETLRLGQWKQTETIVNRHVYGNCLTAANKREWLDNEYDKKLRDLELQMEKQRRNLEQGHLVSRKKLQEKEDNWVDEVKSWARKELINKPVSRQAKAVGSVDGLEITQNKHSLRGLNLEESAILKHDVGSTGCSDNPASSCSSPSGEAISSIHGKSSPPGENIEDAALDNVTVVEPDVDFHDIGQYPANETVHEDSQSGERLPEPASCEVAKSSESGKHNGHDSPVRTQDDQNSHSSDTSSEVNNQNKHDAAAWRGEGNGNEVEQELSNAPELVSASGKRTEDGNGSSGGERNLTCAVASHNFTGAAPPDAEFASATQSGNQNALRPVEAANSHPQDDFDRTNGGTQTSFEGHVTNNSDQSPAELVDNQVEHSLQADAQHTTCSFQQPVQIPGPGTERHASVTTATTIPLTVVNYPYQATPSVQMFLQSSNDPLENESERITKEKNQAILMHEQAKQRLSSECEKEIAEIRRKYDAKLQENESEVLLKAKELDANHQIVHMNNILAKIFRFKDAKNLTPPSTQPESSSSLPQHYVQLVAQLAAQNTTPMPPVVGTPPRHYMELLALLAAQNTMPRPPVVGTPPQHYMQQGLQHTTCSFQHPVQIPRPRSERHVSVTTATPIPPTVANYLYQVTPSVQMLPQSSHDPLENELERITKEKSQAILMHEQEKQRLNSECEMEIAEIRRKYDTKLQQNESEFLLKVKELDANHQIVHMNNILAKIFRYKDAKNLTPPSKPQESSSSLPQHYAQQVAQLAAQNTTPRPPVFCYNSVTESSPSLPQHYVQQVAQLAAQNTMPRPPVVHRPPQLSLMYPGNLCFGSPYRAPMPQLLPPLRSLTQSVVDISTSPSFSHLPSSSQPSINPSGFHNRAHQPEPSISSLSLLDEWLMELDNLANRSGNPPSNCQRLMEVASNSYSLAPSQNIPRRDPLSTADIVHLSDDD